VPSLDVVYTEEAGYVTAGRGVAANLTSLVCSRAGVWAGVLLWLLPGRSDVLGGGWLRDGRWVA
jgi:hypothetical protein